MKTHLTVDQAGRIVLPKAVRRRFHLEQGSLLRLVVESDGIVLKAQDLSAPLVQRGSLLVHQGSAKGDLLTTLDDSRSDRDRQIHGMNE